MSISTRTGLADSMDAHEELLTGQVSNGEGLPPPQNEPAADGPTGNTVNRDPEIFRARAFILERLFDLCLHHVAPPLTDALTIKIKEYAEHLEDLLFRKSFTEDYKNLETLGNRLNEVIRRRDFLRLLQQIAESSGVQGGPPPPQNDAGVGVAADGPANYTFRENLELPLAREFLLEQIFALRLQMQPQPVTDAEKARLKDIAKALEDDIFRTALEDDYMNTETLRSRLRPIIRRYGLTSRQSYPINLSRRRITARDHLMRDNY